MYKLPSRLNAIASFEVLVAAKVRMCAISYCGRQADLEEFGEQEHGDFGRRIRAYTSLKIHGVRGQANHWVRVGIDIVDVVVVS